MRKTIYQAICQRLKEQAPDVQYISLWNNNTAELGAQGAFLMPAVFVEFEPIRWVQLQGRARSADLRVHLHIVTETLASPEDGGQYQTQALEHLDQIERISAAVAGLSGPGFNAFMLAESTTDHDHAGIMNNDECFVTRLTDTSAVPQQATVAGLKPVKR